MAEIRAVLDKEPTQQLFRAGDPVDRANEAFVPRRFFAVLDAANAALVVEDAGVWRLRVPLMRRWLRERA